MVSHHKTGLRCAITDMLEGPRQGLQPHGERHTRLQRDVNRWIAEGMDLIQLREKSLESCEILSLAHLAVALLRDAPERSARPRLLINSRPDVAAAAGADGVHLTARPGELRPEQARAVFRAAGLEQCTVSVSCHTLDDVSAACEGGADLLLFGPVFEKRVQGRVVVQGLGLDVLRSAVLKAGSVPVLALGGITEARISACLATGAGIAGIRLFSVPAPTES